MNRRQFLSALPVALMGTAALAEQPVFHSPGGLALGGYDPVGYFVAGRAVRGSSRYAVVWKGAEWWFVSLENRMAFEANPWAYAPQFGGYCAFAVSQGYTAGGDPQAWVVHDGKLYVTFNPMVRRVWESDPESNAERAQANWPTVLGR